MPEGDTIFRAACALSAALVGRRITRFESVFPSLSRVDEDHPLAGRAIDAIESRGKHLLFFFSGELILHTHMRMHGVWHVYPRGGRWRRPARDMRIVIATEDVSAVGFLIPVAEFLTPKQLDRHDRLQALGPDLAAESFDRVEALRRFNERSDQTVAESLLDQRLVSGIGNVFKSEILFIAGIYPFRLVSSLDAAARERVIDVARRQLRSNVAARGRTMAPTAGRRTTNSLHPAKGLWVYGRSGQPCRKCGTRIEFTRGGPDGRGTYWCPNCQPRTF